MRQMGLEEGDVLQALANPAIDYCSPPKYGGQTRVAVLHPIAVPYDPTTETIITVLWNTQEEYAR